jgi:ATP-binding cassette subfamily C protein CydCD
MNVLRVTFLSALALEMIATLSTAVVAVEIGLRLLSGHLVFEQAFFILLLAPEFYLPLRLLGLRFHAGMAGVEAARRIFELLDTPQVFQLTPTTPTHNSPQPPPRTPPSIHLEKVNFTYSDGRKGLDEASFEIPARQITVLAGESGAGKSTVLSLLLRFVQPQTGSIFVDGITFADIPQQAWINRLAWMPQHPYLFQDSLAANISLARPHASLAEIQEAARLAHADEFIQTFPEKYATQIGEHGVRLSAGQVQRVALARAFLQDAPLLLLDEPGAHLDSETEALLQDSLKKLAQGRTVLVVSHQPHSRLQADQIIWLDEGQVKHVEHKARNQSEYIPLNIGTHQISELRPTDQRKVSLLQPTEANHQTTAPNLSTLLRLLRLLSPFSGRVAASVLLGFLTVGSSMGLMSTAAYLISRAALHPSISELQVAIVGVRFFGLTRGVFRYLERLATHDVTFRLLGKWRGWFFRAVEPLVPARTQHRHSGDLLQHAIGDINALEDFYVRGVAPPIVAAITGLAACLMLVQFSLPMTLFMAGILLISGLGLPVLVLVLSQHSGQELIERRASLNRALVDGIQGMADLLASGQGDHYLNLILEKSRSLGQTQTCLSILNGFQSSASRLLADFGMLGVLWLGARQANLGELEGVMLGALALLAFSCFEAFFPLSQAAQHLSSSLAAAERLFEIADAQPEVVDPHNSIPAPQKIDLRVTDLSFTYPDQAVEGGREVLAQVSLSLTPGRRVALVGPSGAGKSTVLNLLLHFWECRQGAILLNGINLNCFSGDELRKNMSVLPQNPSLFSATLYDNLRLAQPDSGHTEIEKAVSRACLSDWIATLPDGYQTWIGEDGIKLSGGQRQRVALARTLLHRSRLLLLDEPAAHLDPKTELALLSGILDTAKEYDSSLLLVTHRLIGMERMDEILVMQNGRIVERGSHNKLIQNNGLYLKMLGLQGLTYTVE